MQQNLQLSADILWPCPLCCYAVICVCILYLYIEMFCVNIHVVMAYTACMIDDKLAWFNLFAYCFTILQY